MNIVLVGAATYSIMGHIFTKNVPVAVSEQDAAILLDKESDSGVLYFKRSADQDAPATPLLAKPAPKAEAPKAPVKKGNITITAKKGPTKAKVEVTSPEENEELDNELGITADDDEDADSDKDASVTI